MDWVQIIPSILSLSFSIALVLAVQRVKKAQVEMQVSEYSFRNQNRMKISHIRVRNKPIRFGWMNRDLATNCRAVVKVIDASNGQLKGKFSGLKWALNPEPLRYELRKTDHLL